MKISYRNADGGITLILGAPKADIERSVGRKLSDAEYRAIVSKDIPDGVAEVQELPEDWQPIKDRTFRNAWEIDGKGVTVRMDKARDIHRKTLRVQRQAELAKLDVEQIRAMETDDKAGLADVAAKKQKLRDAPAHPAIEAAATPDELKAITLADLAR